MKDDRLRVRVDAAYCEALGLAMICFARLEWAAVYCCEKLSPGYLSTISNQTAGQIANDLVTFAPRHSDPAIVQSLGLAAAEFKTLTKRRNDLIHANPGTATGGEQWLFRHGEDWSPEKVNSLADAFVAAGLVLNDHYHNLL